MRLKHLCTAVLTVVTLMGANASADLAFVTTAPTTNIFGVGDIGGAPQGSASSQQAFGFRNADAAGTDGTRTRGQSFTFSTGSGLAYAIETLSVSLNSSNGNGVRPDGQLTLTVFDWDSNNPDGFTNWDSGTGGQFPSGHNEIFSESFAVAAGTQLTNQQWAEISFAPGQLQLVDGQSYGFIFRYQLDSIAGLNSDVTIAFDTRQDANSAGALLNTNVNANFANADNGQSTGRDFNFFIDGQAVPEPTSIAWLGLSALGLVARRRRS